MLFLNCTRTGKDKIITRFFLCTLNPPFNTCHPFLNPDSIYPKDTYAISCPVSKFRPFTCIFWAPGRYAAKQAASPLLLASFNWLSIFSWFSQTFIHLIYFPILPSANCLLQLIWQLPGSTIYRLVQLCCLKLFKSVCKIKHILISKYSYLSI